MVGTPALLCSYDQILIHIMATLYRKYRPQTFDQAVGQNHVKVTLENEIQTGKFSHAYLFCGPRAVGKTTLARVLAKSINCENRKDGEHEPCDECSACQEIIEGKSLDIVEIDAASHTGVDNVRENIIAASKISPSKLDYKVFVIDEVHMLSISAFNALLKVLEEPPSNVVFVLCTTEVHRVPSTIISRCERFDFKRVSMTDMVKKLTYVADQEDIKIDKEVLEQVAAHSEGYMRDAESLLGQLVAISGKEITQKEADLVLPRSDVDMIMDLLDKIVKKDASKGIRIINNLVDDGVDLKKFTSDLIEILRKMMLNKLDPGLGEKLGFELGEKMEVDLQELNKQLNVNRLVELINVFSEARNQLKGAFIVQLPLELAVTKLCSEVEARPQQEKKSAESKGQPQNSPSKEQKTQPEKPKAEESASTQEQGEATAESGEEQATSSLNEINRDTIVAKWDEVLSRIKKHNHSLSFILKMCTPGEVKDSSVCLVFKYKFHRDRINDGKIKGLVEDTLKEVFGSELKVEADLDENLEIEEKGGVQEQQNGKDEKGAEEGGNNEEGGEDEGMVDDLLQTFGGKVVK